MTDPNGIRYDYKKKDVILYNLGLGAKQSDLAWVFEGSPSFEVLPSFGTALASPVRKGYPADADLIQLGVIAYNDGSLAMRLAPLLPNFSYVRLN